MVRPLAPKTKGDNKTHGDEPKDKKAKYTISMEGEFEFLLPGPNNVQNTMTRANSFDYSC